jgi:predicted HTH transcriptional regulator
MISIVILGIGILIGAFVVAGIVWAVREDMKPADAKSFGEATQFERKEENLKKILGLFEENKKVTNNEVEKMLGVSNATAERYLDELESQGKIRQVGKTGHYTYYEKIK